MDRRELATAIVEAETTSSKDQARSWLNWCRLCAKQAEVGQENATIFSDNGDCSLATSVGKYFWVNIKLEDEIPKSLCQECRQLIDELVAFTERVNKVQSMYCLLENLNPTSLEFANKLRSQCGLIDDDNWEHIIRMKKEPPQKPALVNREAQTDLVIFFNSQSREESASKHIPPRKEEVIKEGQLLQEQEKSDGDAEQEHTYEYVLNEDNDEGEVEALSYSEDGMKFKIHAVSTARDDLEVEDSDLFKELKFKTEDNEDNDYVKHVSSDGKQVCLEIQQLGDQSDSNMAEDVDEDPDEADEEEDYIEILDLKSELSMSDSTASNSELLPKRKRGRPSRLSKTGTASSESDYRYSCPDCKRKYKNPTIYRKHMLTNHGIVVGQLQDFVCSQCGKDCGTESSLKRHIRLHLPDEEKYTVACPFCEKKFSQEGAMRQHVNGIHHQMKPFICHQCGRACKTLAALNEHQLVHTDECPFECEVCKKRFKNKPRLKSHMDTHNASDYTCPDCGLKLNTKRTLLQHRLVHSDVKRFKCQFCDAAFKRSKALKNHLILHTGLRPYKCPFCEKSFSNGSNCRSHKKRSHPKELAEEEALGKKSEPAPVPKLEDLKAAKSIVQPRKIKRNAGGLPDHFRRLLMSAEKRKKRNGEDSDNAAAEENYEMADIQYEIEGEFEDEESQELVDDCEETVIYEIIGEV